MEKFINEFMTKFWKAFFLMLYLKTRTEKVLNSLLFLEPERGLCVCLGKNSENFSFFKDVCGGTLI